jgi:hypothetical protein
MIAPCPFSCLRRPSHEIARYLTHEPIRWPLLPRIVCRDGRHTSARNHAGVAARLCSNAQQTSTMAIFAASVRFGSVHLSSGRVDVPSHQPTLYAVLCSTRASSNALHTCTESSQWTHDAVERVIRRSHQPAHSDMPHAEFMHQYTALISTVSWTVRSVTAQQHNNTQLKHTAKTKA